MTQIAVRILHSAVNYIHCQAKFARIYLSRLLDYNAKRDAVNDAETIELRKKGLESLERSHSSGIVLYRNIFCKSKPTSTERFEERKRKQLSADNYQKLMKSRRAKYPKCYQKTHHADNSVRQLQERQLAGRVRVRAVEAAVPTALIIAQPGQQREIGVLRPTTAAPLCEQPCTPKRDAEPIPLPPAEQLPSLSPDSNLAEQPFVTYLLLLKDSYLYVGKTDRKFYKRLNEHLDIRDHISHKGAGWTALHKPISTLALYPGNVERSLTIRAMAAYGMERTRGYGWCQVDVEKHLYSCHNILHLPCLPPLPPPIYNPKKVLIFPRAHLDLLAPVPTPVSSLMGCVDIPPPPPLASAISASSTPPTAKFPDVQRFHSLFVRHSSCHHNPKPLIVSSVKTVMHKMYNICDWSLTSPALRKLLHLHVSSHPHAHHKIFLAKPDYLCYQTAWNEYHLDQLDSFKEHMDNEQNDDPCLT